MSFVEFNIHKQVCSIELSREEKRNAFNPEMIEELTQAFEKAAKDSEVAVVLLRGKGKSFCAGADLGWMQSMVNYNFDENLEDSHKLHKMFEALEAINVPVICYVQGHVMGGALGLLGVSDYVYSDEQTKFGFTEVRLGLVPAVISPFCLKRLNLKDAKQLMMSGEVFSAKQASEVGLVDSVGRMDEIQQHIDELIKHFKTLSLPAVKATKKLLNDINQMSDLQQVTPLTTKVISERRVSEDAQTRLKNFLNKAKK
ncbi:MAG: enoyl-CoA hydratase-related protein [Bdellovibrionales bacterium]|nr:enoyl-CoA hydratase-related protein [Bdellovibrionales bacterium]